MFYLIQRKVSCLIFNAFLSNLPQFLNNTVTISIYRIYTNLPEPPKIPKSPISYLPKSFYPCVTFLTNLAQRVSGYKDTNWYKFNKPLDNTIQIMSPESYRKWWYSSCTESLVCFCQKIPIHLEELLMQTFWSFWEQADHYCRYEFVELP